MSEATWSIPLSDLAVDDETSLVEALEIARRLGAGPLTRRVTGRMRELAVHVPAGLRASPPAR